MPLDPVSVMLPAVVVSVPFVASVPLLLRNVRFPLPVEIAEPGSVKVPEEITLNGLFALSVGVASVRLPVLVTNAPPVPTVRFSVPPAEVLRMLLASVPMPLAPEFGTANAITPAAPTFSDVPAACVIDPPVALPPLLVTTVIVPPAPVVMSRSAAPPVPPVPVFTLIATALAPVLPVVIEPPALCAKPSDPAPFVLALMVMLPVLPLPSAAPSVIASPLFNVIAPPPVLVAPPMFNVPLVEVS